MTQPRHHQHIQNQENCKEVEIVSEKTGLEKFVLICKEPFLKRFAHYRKNHVHFWTDLFLLCTIAVLIGALATIWIFNHTKRTNMVDFQITYDASRLINASPFNFEVAYKNTSKKVTASDAKVVIKFPPSLQNINVDYPNYDKEAQTVSLGEILPGSEGRFAIESLALANLGEAQKIIFVLNYTNDLGQPQQEYTAKEFTITTSLVKTSLSIPQKVIGGSDFDSIFEINNLSALALENAKLKIDYPSSYRFGFSNPWEIGKFIAGEKKSFSFTGAVSREGQGQKDFNVSLLASYNSQEFLIAKAAARATIIQSKVILQFIDTDKSANLNPGDQTQLSLNYNNLESFDLINPTLAVSISGDFLDQNFLKKSYGEMYHDGKLFFDAGSSIKAGQANTQNFLIAALPSVVYKDTPTAQDITLQAELVYQDGEESLHLTSSALQIPINSRLGIRSEGVFYTSDGDQIGVGSIPPKPGEYTAYWVVLEVTNGINKVRNVRVTASLPPGAEYDEVFNVSRGAPINYNKSQNTVEWYIPELDPLDGVINPAAQARLEIAVIPEENQIGKILPLLTNIKVTAVDDRTAFQLNSSAKDVSTAIFKENEKNKVAP